MNNPRPLPKLSIPDTIVGPWKPRVWEQTATEVIKALADPDQREAARERLAACGPAVAPPLIEELLDTASPVPAWEIEMVLSKRIGPAAYDEVLAALATASDEESRRRLSATFSAFGTVDRYKEALGHPSASVRKSAAIGIQYACSVDYGREPNPDVDYGRVIDALIPLLADPDPGVAQRAMWVLSMLGPGVVEPLRRVRRHGPGRLRAGALSVLAAVGGEEALSAADRAAVERLIRIKLPHDQARPLDTCFTSWFAVPGGDQQGVVDVLDLYDARPATFALGLSIGAHDSHDGAEYGRVYVTPEVDGWTLVLGPWCNPVDPERAEDVLRVVTELSRRYGRAQAYYFGEQGGGSGWLVAEDGNVIRRCSGSWDTDDARYSLGEPLPEERAACVEEGITPPGDDPADDGENEEEWADLAPYLAPELAGRLGVNPFDLGPDTTVWGAGIVALTPYAREHGKPATGAYAI
ncbi:HEAT repeat domain-containing protein [Streptomyces sp. NPDC048191]|uniref:HEAT repeat domain-containing protein n=1 Tax=Streptomyces sp. NPDC048191 TaxID=3155484 RepID=UPI0033C75C24